MNPSSQTMTTTYEMSQLPYSMTALEPVISQSTLEFHYGKHFKTYIDNLNRLVKDTPFEGMLLEEIVKNAPEGPLFNNAGQVLNHAMYFEQFTAYPSLQTEPKGRLAEAIRFDFGSFENFQSQMEENCKALFGSGWVWLAQNKNGKLSIVNCYNGNNPMHMDMRPIFCIDVWEHAYYLDYQNRRADHVRKLFEIINWERIANRLHN